MRIASRISAWTAILLLACPAIVAARSTESRDQAPDRLDDVHLVPPGALQELRLRDGSRLYGRVESVGDQLVVFRTAAGVELTVPKSEIVSLIVVRGRLVNGEFRRFDPNSARLLFGPTARTPAAGDGYVGVFQLIAPFVQVGVTDRVSVGAGTPLIFGVFDSRPVWITPKVQVYRSDRTQAAVGLMHVFNLEDASGGVAYTVVTLGSPDSSVSIGGGLGYAREAHTPAEYTGVAMIGGERQIARRIKLLTENYVWPRSAILSGGIRFFGERLSADVGLAVPLDVEAFVALPVVNVAWAF
jgi:hypothetical protein